MGKTKSYMLCEWFFDVVEAQRRLNRLENFYNYVSLCLGDNYRIHIYDKAQFDTIVATLKAVYGDDFIGKVVEDEHAYYFRYCEFNVFTLK